MESENQTNNFTDQEIMAIATFEALLRRIHERLITEGYVINNSGIIPPTFPTSPEHGNIPAHRT